MEGNTANEVSLFGTKRQTEELAGPGRAVTAECTNQRATPPQAYTVEAKAGRCLVH